MTNFKSVGFENHFFIVFSRELDATERQFVEQVIGYLSRSELKQAEGPSFEWLYLGQVLEVSIDTTKTYSDDISFLFPAFWEGLENYLRNGSKPYSRAMRGHPKGFQLIPSIGFDPGLVKQVFSDVFWPDNLNTLYYTHDALVTQVREYMEDNYSEKVEDTSEDSEGTQDIVIQVPKGAKKVRINLEFDL